jgi:uncharacterized protein YgiM (DUF1202 family)
MKRRMKRIGVWSVVVLLGVLMARAQDSCPALVGDAINLVGQACTGLGRNQLCYGNRLVTATTWEGVDLSEFAEPGDKVGVSEVASIATFPASSADETWGVALVSLQANLPDTLPGQNVIFVLFGEAQIESQVPPDDAAPSVTLPAAATSNPNLRSGPGTNYAIAGSLRQGEQVTVIGRNDVGDWLLVEGEGRAAWVFAELVSVEGDVTTLDVTDVSATLSASYRAPLQAFRLTTGLGRPNCAEVPLDGLLIQSPDGTTVKFLINGVEISMASTALVRTVEEDRLRVANLEGSVTVTTAGTSVELEPGEYTEVSADEQPARPQGYSHDDAHDLPVEVLPQQVQLPIPSGEGSVAYSAFFCNFRGGASGVRAGQTLVVDAGWRDPLRQVTAFLNSATLTVTYDGDPVPVWSKSGPTAVDGTDYIGYWYWSIPAVEAGEHTLVLTVANFDTGGIGNTFTCNLTVR